MIRILDEKFVDGIGYIDPTAEWQDIPEDIAAHIQTADDLIACGALKAKDAKVGDLVKIDFDQSERSIDPESLYDYKITEIRYGDSNLGDITIVTDDGQELHYDNKDLIGWLVDPNDLGDMRQCRADYDLAKYEATEIPLRSFNSLNDLANYMDVHNVELSELGLEDEELGRLMWRALMPSVKQIADRLDIYHEDIAPRVYAWLKNFMENK